jgi:hypothetical protein
MHSNYFQEVKISLLKHLDRSRQEISGASRTNEENAFLLCPRRKKFSFKPFVLVMSRHQVVQE